MLDGESHRYVGCSHGIPGRKEGQIQLGCGELEG